LALAVETQAVVELRRVGKVYSTGANEFTALRDVDLRVEPGEFVAIMGPSGSGKSTLMNLIGLLDRPTTGEYLIDGLDIQRYDDDGLARLRGQKIGFIFQSFNLIPRASALKNVTMPLVYAGVEPREREERARELLDQLGIGEWSHHRPKELSGGQQQRVAIARALVNRPSLILADEPTGNLDSKSGRDVLSLLSNLHQQGTTILVVTHDENVARRARRIIRLFDGDIVEDTPVEAPIPFSRPEERAG
jgi:putative ABC transport system ATP-binding protein